MDEKEKPKKRKFRLANHINTISFFVIIPIFLALSIVSYLLISWLPAILYVIGLIIFLFLYTKEEKKDDDEEDFDEIMEMHGIE